MDPVALRIPAGPEFIRPVRALAIEVGGRAGLSVSDAADVAAAVAEMTAYLTGSQGRDGTIEITFTTSADKLEVVGVATLAPGNKVRTDITDVTERILRGAVDNAVFDTQDGTPTFRLFKQLA